ncbi:biotin/lipoyl-containing protein, partial [Zavarzinella formosa]|uniref:biotin/lipoyl-containing protein n=1 Tax=Zavarzinella formosa TaxID=360055 RepID=UPI001930A0AF
MDFRLPELGEGIADATVVNVAVKPGQAVKAGDTLIEVETDKASMPITATSDGTVTELKVKQGDKVKVGAVVAIFGGGSSAPATPTAAPAKPAAAPAPAAKEAEAPKAAPAAAAPAGDFQQKLPNLGEGIENGTIVAVSVKAGDTVKAGQEIFVIETDKASMPVPSDVDGTVKEIKVKVGDKVSIGAVIAVIASSGAASTKAAPTPAPTGEKAAPAKAQSAPTAPASENG